MDIQVQLTTQCNERCIFCRKYTWKHRSMSPAILLKVLKKYDPDIVAYQFSGGDPLMYEHLDLLKEFMCGKNYKVYTNMAFDLNSTQREFLNNASSISVSFDGFSTYIYNKIRNPLDKEAHSKVLRNVLEYKDKVVLCTVLTEDVLPDVNQILNFGFENHIKTRFYPLHTNMEHEADKESLKKVLENVDKTRLYDTNILNILDDQKVCSFPCYIRNNHRVIDELGREYSCCYAINDNGSDIDGMYAIDNVNEDFALLDINKVYPYCSRCTRYSRNNEIIKQVSKIKFL